MSRSLPFSAAERAPKIEWLGDRGVTADGFTFRLWFGETSRMVLAEVKPPTGHASVTARKTRAEAEVWCAAEVAEMRRARRDPTKPQQDNNREAS